MNETDKILAENLKVLRKFYPDIERKISADIENENITDRVFADKSLDGNYIFGVAENGRDRYFNSRYYPQNAAKEWAEQYKEINFKSIFIIMGLANGMYVRELLKKITNTNEVVLYEPDEELFGLIIQYADISDIIKNKSLKLVVGEINKNLLAETILLKIDYSNMNILKYAAVPNYINAYVNQWHDLIEDIKKRVEFIVLNRNTEIYYKYEFIENMFENYQDMIKQYTINQIRHAFEKISVENIPAILVAAGPSLDKNISALAAAKGRAFIIAVDTALNSMAKAGIIPDMSITIDPHKPVSLFASEAMKSVPMVVCQYSNNDVIAILKGKRFYIGEMGYMAHTYIKHGKEPAMFLETGGSVANNAFSLLQFIGFKTIILVGQDLAYTENKSHTESAYIGANNTVNFDGSKEMADAVGGGKVMTSKVMRCYNDWFERQILRYPELKVINATEGGAVKRGSIEMPLSEAISATCNAEYDFEKILREINPIFDADEQDSIVNEFGMIREEIDKCMDKIDEGIKSYDRFLSLHKENRTLGKEYRDVLKEIEDINRYADNNPILRLASVYNAQDNYEVQAEVYDISEDELEEVKNIRRLGVKMLESYKEALNDMKEDSVYLTNSGILRKFLSYIQKILREVDYASYEYRKQNIYMGSVHFRRFTNLAEYLIALYLNNIDELKSYNVLFNIEEIMSGIAAINFAMENKDYILCTDIMQYNVKPTLINTMSDAVENGLMESENHKRENMSILEKMEPELHAQVLDETITGGQYEEELTSYGYVTLKKCGENGFYFHSNQNPELEARMQLDNMKFEYDDIAIVGIGLGYIVEELRERKYSGNIFIFETDINVIRAALKVMNLRGLYSKCKMKIIYDPDFRDFSNLMKIKNSGADIFFHEPSVRNIQNDRVRKIVEETRMNIVSAREQESFLKANFKKNIKDVHFTLDDEKEKIRNKTVICVAGGASLDDDTGELKKKSKDKNNVIIAAGTVYKKLRKEGIIPQYVMITDAKQSIKGQISDTDTSGTTLLYLSTAGSEAAEAWKGAKSIIFQKGMYEAEKYAFEHNLTTVDTGGSVATTALAAAAGMGAARVVCVGYDFAFVNDYTHAAGTGRVKLTDKDRLRMVKSVSGEDIPTYVNLDIYRHWIERYIKDISDVEFINCSGGAYIDGMEHMSLGNI